MVTATKLVDKFTKVPTPTISRQSNRRSLTPEFQRRAKKLWIWSSIMLSRNLSTGAVEYEQRMD
jgi:hypothetical protein